MYFLDMQRKEDIAAIYVCLTTIKKKTEYLKTGKICSGILLSLGPL